MTIFKFNAHLSLGRRIFPIARDTRRPLEKGWQQRRYTRTRLIEYAKQGCTAFGWALGPQDIVIDIDARKPLSRHSEARLLEDMQCTNLVLSYKTPTVITGRGGTHYYFRLPDGIVVSKKYCPDYPDLEFLHHGNYVIIAGSIHAISRKPYYWADLTPYDQTPTVMPYWLAQKLQHKIELPSSKPDVIIISPLELAALLNKCPVHEYHNYDAWLNMLFACHHATNGLGLEAFVAWSIADPMYTDQRGIIEYKWRNIKNEAPRLMTLAHLEAEAAKWSVVKYLAENSCQEKQQRAKTTPPAIEINNPEIQALCNFIAENPPQNDAALAAIYEKIIEIGPTAHKPVYETLKALRAVTWNAYQKGIAAHTPRAKKPDIAKMAALELQQQYNNGDYIVFAPNRQFYIYNQTHWVMPHKEYLQRQLEPIIARLCLEHNRPENTRLLEDAWKRLAVCTTRKEDPFNFRGQPQPIINCTNIEIHITANGDIEPKAHKFSSYLVNRIDTTFEPGAKCPMFNFMLQGIFRDAIAPQEIIRHLYEVIGYIIQPLKNIPAWFLFHGPGENGKTQVIKVIEQLVGPHATIHRPIAQLATNDTHASANLVGVLLLIDDDMDLGVLPSAALKRYAESTGMEANPKYGDRFQFRCNTSIIGNANHWPDIRDISHGMLRKTYVFPFRRQFLPDEIDPNLTPWIIQEELPGVLQEALRGYQRLRFRGRFEVPEACEKAKNEWLIHSSPIYQWVTTHLISAYEENVSLKEAYDRFQSWATIEYGLRYRPDRGRFIQVLSDRGYSITADCIVGHTIKDV